LRQEDRGGHFAYNDLMAIGAILACQRGLNVPKDVAIVGFDDIDRLLSVRPGHGRSINTGWGAEQPTLLEKMGPATRPSCGGLSDGTTSAIRGARGDHKQTHQILADLIAANSAVIGRQEVCRGWLPRLYPFERIDGLPSGHDGVQCDARIGKHCHPTVTPLYETSATFRGFRRWIRLTERPPGEARWLAGLEKAP
jgi:hypothetical protein